MQSLRCCLRVFEDAAFRPTELLPLLHAGNFVGRKVVHHRDVVALERRRQALLDIGHERCANSFANWRHDHPAQLSRKVLRILDRLGCFSFLKALASIWRMRSRVTENCWPTSSKV